MVKVYNIGINVCLMTNQKRWKRRTFSQTEKKNVCIVCRLSNCKAPPTALKIVSKEGVMPPDEPNAEERLEELSQDYDTPFSIPDDSREVMLSQGGVAFTGGKLDSTHPATDTNIQLEELYDEGVAGAAEASEPNIDDVVTGYDPGASRRRLT